MGFIHLHVHSEYSLLSSVARIEQLVSAAKEDGATALALCDEQAMYGVIPFYKECLKKGIKPIIGVEYWIRSTQPTSVKEQGDTKLVLLAENEVGYEQLLALTTKVQLQDKRNQILEKESLQDHTEGLIAILSFDQGEVSALIAKDQYAEALQVVNSYEQLYGKDNVFVELQQHSRADAELVARIAKWAMTEGIETVASNHIHFVHKRDELDYEVVNALREGATLRERSKNESTSHFYYKSQKEMETLFASYPKAIENTLRIAERCHVTIELGKNHLPKYKLASGVTASTMLERISFQGLTDKLERISPEYEERLRYELQVIENMGFSDYFLIVWDFMKYAYEQGIKTGPGRGSAAGSLVAYALNITKVDPIRFELLFERFLNPDRISLPDIDIDFPDHRRDKVIQYVREKYGANHVAQIITFGTMAARAAIRDVGRVLNTDSRLIDQIAKAIPGVPRMTLEKALEENAQLKRLINESEEAKQVFSLAKKIEGLPRHTSTHAAGVVISHEPLTKLVPLQSGQDETALTQYPMEALEEIGLLKMDFLGLRNLTLIEKIIGLIEKNKRIKLDLGELNLEDEAVFSLLSKGETTGIFQLESEGMRRVLKQLKPTEFEDIVAVNALYRPGPMEQIPVYIKGKHGQKKVTYAHPDLEPILKSTYGVIIYQEQIMQIAAKMAGFTLGEADLLRRAVSKKKLDILEKERQHFLLGAKEKGYDDAVANDVYNLIVRFANYGFNRSHAVAYSMIAYELAYLKCYHPDAFYTALCSSVTHHQEKLKQYVSEAKMLGIQVKLPHINESEYDFTLTGDGIQFGLASIKNVGQRAADYIVTERKKRPFKDLYDFCYRIDPRIVPERTVQALVLAGCFDSLGSHRASLLASLDDLLIAAKEYRSGVEEKGFLFDLEVEGQTYLPVPPYSEKELLQLEKETFGFYVSNHPISMYNDLLAEYKRVRTIEALNEAQHRVRIAGMLEMLRLVKTKNDSVMAFAKLSDEAGELDLVIFPKIYSEYRDVLRNGALLFLEGEINRQKNDHSFIVNKLIAIENLSNKRKQRVYLRVEANDKQQKLEQLKLLLQRYPGQTEVIYHDSQTKKTMKLPTSYSVQVTDELLFELEILLGKKNVIVK